MAACSQRSPVCASPPELDEEDELLEPDDEELPLELEEEDELPPVLDEDEAPLLLDMLPELPVPASESSSPSSPASAPQAWLAPAPASEMPTRTHDSFFMRGTLAERSPSRKALDVPSLAPVAADAASCEPVGQ